ncbi:MAG: 3-dehydroquinate synthase II [Thermoprotei archaeon]
MSSKPVYVNTRDTRILDSVKSEITGIFRQSSQGGYELCKFGNNGSGEQVTRLDGHGASYFELSSHADEEAVLEAARHGSMLNVVKALNWKVIPFENLIVQLHLAGAEVYAHVPASDVSLASQVMEKGVDGLVIDIETPEQLQFLQSMAKASGSVELVKGEITEVVNVGLGDRVCVDTTSVLSQGEGLLVGNTSSFFFLIHNENLQSEFAAPRPFRVNAGGVHAYVLQASDKTNYLSELRAGSSVLIVSPNGSRTVTVGRVKIERRPMALVRARCGDRDGSVIVQLAETIRFLNEKGMPVSVTELKPGAKVLVHVASVVGRHFGSKVEETITEM